MGSARGGVGRVLTAALMPGASAAALQEQEPAWMWEVAAGLSWQHPSRPGAFAVFGDAHIPPCPVHAYWGLLLSIHTGSGCTGGTAQARSTATSPSHSGICPCTPVGAEGASSILTTAKHPPRRTASWQWGRCQQAGQE